MADADAPQKAGHRIALGADHAGYSLKKSLADALHGQGLEVVDLGAHDEESCDYPKYAHKMAKMVASGEVERGVLVCGSGLGMSIAANRHKGVRAALVGDAVAARLARQHNDANILVLPGRFISQKSAVECLREYLSAEFEGGRHLRRIRAIDEFAD